MLIQDVAEFHRQIQRGDSRQHGVANQHRMWGSKPRFSMKITIIAVVRRTLNQTRGFGAPWRIPIAAGNFDAQFPPQRKEPEHCRCAPVPGFNIAQRIQANETL
ncbi:hypothetical protein TNCV_739701 [Trichonephila clavipes]|nr:hypothetical protein TNCV_739701 [Trichonephila clavipes]